MPTTVRRPLLRMISALVVSSALFLAAIIITEVDYLTASGNILKFPFWGIALAIEFAGYVWTDFPESRDTRISASPMEDRLCALTIIIIGEGALVAGCLYSTEF